MSVHSVTKVKVISGFFNHSNSKYGWCCCPVGAACPAERRQLGVSPQRLAEEHHLPADDPHTGPTGRR